MELKVFRDVLCGGGGCCAVQAEIPVETEILISDYLPQVFKVVKCFARPVVLQKQLQPGRLTWRLHPLHRLLSGEEGAGLCQTEQKLPFTRCWSCRTSLCRMERPGGRADRVHQLPGRHPAADRGAGAYSLAASVSTQAAAEAITALTGCGIQQRLAVLRGCGGPPCWISCLPPTGRWPLPSRPPPCWTSAAAPPSPRSSCWRARRWSRADPGPLRLEKPGQRRPAEPGGGHPL